MKMSFEMGMSTVLVSSYVFSIVAVTFAITHRGDINTVSYLMLVSYVMFFGIWLLRILNRLFKRD